MTNLVAQYKASDLSQRDFAARHGISKSKFHYWLTKLSKSVKTLPLVTESSFLPIAISPSPSEKPEQVIMIRLPSGVEIEIPV